jgi:hypothetical protein
MSFLNNWYSTALDAEPTFAQPMTGTTWEDAYDDWLRDFLNAKQTKMNIWSASMLATLNGLIIQAPANVANSYNAFLAAQAVGNGVLSANAFAFGNIYQNLMV